MKRKLLIYSVSIALLTSIFQAAPAFASRPVTEGQINQTKGQINETIVQIEDLETKLQQLDDRIMIGMEKSKQLNEDIKEQQGQIVKTKAEIETAKKDLETNKAYYSTRLKTMQEQGQQPMISYAEFILSSDSLSQLLTRSTAIMQILDSNTDVMNALAKKEDSLTAAEQKLEKELSQLKTSKDELVSKQKQVEADKVEMNKVLADSKDTLKQQKTQLATEETLKNAQDKARQEAQEALEKARREAEERAQQQAPASPSKKAPASPSKKAPRVTSNNNNNQNNNNNSNNENNNNNNDNSPSITNDDGATNSDKADAVIAYAKRFLGVPYVWGGTSPSGFDCSGLTQYVFRSVGISLPRVSRDQQDVGTSISPYNVKKGDLVFRGNPAYHVGIYIGGGKYIHAPQTGDVVRIRDYNPAKFTTAARVLH